MYEATIGVNENETTNGLNTDVALSSALYDTDALNVPEHILFPDELNRYLRDRIQVYRDRAIGLLFIYWLSLLFVALNTAEWHVAEEVS